MVLKLTVYRDGLDGIYLAAGEVRKMHNFLKLFLTGMISNITEKLLRLHDMWEVCR